MHTKLCVSAVRTLIGRMLLDVHHHLCSHDGFSDSDTDTDVDKVVCRNNHQPLHEKNHYPDSDGTTTLCDIRK